MTKHEKELERVADFQTMMDTVRWAAECADQLDRDVEENVESDSHVYELWSAIDRAAKAKLNYLTKHAPKHL